MLVRFSPIKNRKMLARDGFDTFLFISAFLMTSLKRTARPKMAALTDVLSRLSNVYFWQTGRENGVIYIYIYIYIFLLFIFYLFFNSVCLSLIAVLSIGPVLLVRFRSLSVGNQSFEERTTIGPNSETAATATAARRSEQPSLQSRPRGFEYFFIYTF